MPELPEVERAARILRTAITGAVVDRVQLLHPALRRRVSPKSLRALRGATVSAVERRGKHQLIHLTDGRIVHVHFRMNGDWHIDHTSDPLPRFARAVLSFVGGVRVVLDDSRALSSLEVHTAAMPPELGLGPEPDDTTVASLRSSLARRRIPIKVALLDQRVIAGLGNIYASEALWRARIDPRLASSSLGDAQLSRLLAGIRAVIARANGTRYFGARRGRFDVYDRLGRPCRRCRTPIARVVQSGRSTYFCPYCQRPPSRSTGGAVAAPSRTA